MPRINTDEILREFGDWRNTADLMKAGRIAIERLNSYLQEGITFNQETTLCGLYCEQYTGQSNWDMG
ncbi:ATPase [Hungatella hathewayi]|nr:ATPase [Hungatella hathewayi]